MAQEEQRTTRLSEVGVRVRSALLGSAFFTFSTPATPGTDFNDGRGHATFANAGSFRIAPERLRCRSRIAYAMLNAKIIIQIQ